MGGMKSMSLDIDELLMTVVTIDRVDDLGDSLHEAGWRTPTEVAVALRAMREGDFARAAIILQGTGDANPVSVEEPS